jgi:SSS family solute:Na+ symporter
MLARMGATLYLLGKALSPMLEWDLTTIILLTGSLVTLYTLVGGTEAVVWTDAVHNLVLVVGVVVCVGLQLAGMPQGPGQVVTIAAEHDKFSLGSTSASVSTATVWVMLLYGLFANLQNFGIDQNYVQRYISARDDGAARRSLWLGGLTYLPLSALLLFIGTGLFAFYSSRPGLLPPEVAARPDDVFPYFITHSLPRGMAGLVIAAVFAAAMNGFGLNVVSTITLCDLYQRYVRPRASERESMRVLYAATVAWGALATGVALWLAMLNSKHLMDVWWEMAGVFSGGMLGLFLLGMMSRTATGRAAAVAVVAGLLVILWMTVSPRWDAWPKALRSPFHGNLVIVFATLTILIVGMALASLSPRSRQAAVTSRSLSSAGKGSEGRAESVL